MIFVYQKGMLMTRLGKMARLPGQMRDGLTEARFPGLNLDGLGKSAGMPPQELGSCREAKARRPRAQTGPGEARDLAEAPIKANQTKSNQIKPRRQRRSGQWLVVSG
jgi:hypothetical protein